MRSVDTLIIFVMCLLFLFVFVVLILCMPTSLPAHTHAGWEAYRFALVRMSVAQFCVNRNSKGICSE